MKNLLPFALMSRNSPANPAPIAAAILRVCIATLLTQGCGGTTEAPPCRSDAAWCQFAGGNSPRLYHSAVWTGDELLVWGGLDGGYDDPNAAPLDTGLRVNPQTGEIRPMSRVGAPSPRYSHFAVWTGTELLVWGGRLQKVDGVVGRATAGGSYDPSTDSWRALPEPDGVPRTAESVAWTGEGLFVWGGDKGDGLVRSGFVYNPASDDSRIIATDLPQAAVVDADAVAVDGKVLITGGKTNFPDADPLVYDVTTDMWTETAPPPVPGTDGVGAPSFAHDGVAYVCNATQLLCGGYAVATDTWQSFALTGFPDRFAFWPAFALAGHDLVLFGLIDDGVSSDRSVATVFDIDTGSWRGLPFEGAPLPRRGQTATWTGTSLLFWGGAAAQVPGAEEGSRLTWP